MPLFSQLSFTHHSLAHFSFLLTPSQSKQNTTRKSIEQERTVDYRTPVGALGSPGGEGSWLSALGGWAAWLRGGWAASRRGRAAGQAGTLIAFALWDPPYMCRGFPTTLLFFFKTILQSKHWIILTCYQKVKRRRLVHVFMKPVFQAAETLFTAGWCRHERNSLHTQFPKELIAVLFDYLENIK